jgi:hypothetical protein
MTHQGACYYGWAPPPQKKIRSKFQEMPLCVTQHTQLTEAFFMSECRTVPRYTSKCSFIHAHTQSPAFPVPIFRKLTAAGHHYVPKPSTNFHANRCINMDNAGTNIFTPLKKVRTSIGLSSRNSYTEFHENSSKRFSSRQTDGRS